MQPVNLPWNEWLKLPINRDDIRFERYLDFNIDSLLKAGYNVLMYKAPFVHNIVPSHYQGHDIRLLLVQDNPIHLGWWFTNSYGHSRLGAPDCMGYMEYVKAGFTGNDLRSMPVGYLLQ